MRNRNLRVLAAAVIVALCGWWAFSVPTRPVSAASSAATTIIQKGIEENASYTAGNSVFASDITFTPRCGYGRPVGSVPNSAYSIAGAGLRRSGAGRP